ncbi:ImpA family metalloprotease [Rhodoferax sp.]|uniref:ImpA family metalloprotease n=1 Tax=Rhodoferax sp. TaxID=50421 RepID=UPI0025EBBD5F|nr:ImpA family metalloprotease [Rhodoferax sp.]
MNPVSPISPLSQAVPERSPALISARAAATACLTAFLVACGGGGDGGGGSGSTPAGVSAPVPAPAANTAVTQALASGDASALTDAKVVAQHAQYAQQQITQAQAARTSSLYQGVSTEYDPSQWSYWVQPRNTATAQPLIVGDQGNALASISVAGGGRSAGFGVQVLAKFNNNELVAYRPAFQRLLAWLVSADAAAALPASLKVAFAGIPATQAAAGFVKAGVPVTTIACDFITTPACAATAHLLVVGGDLSANAGLEASVRALVAAGRPVLYVHTKSNWTSDSAIQVLAGMGLQFGPYGGNYWASDKVAPGRSAATNATASDQFAKTRVMLSLLASDSFSMSYDWGPCTVNAGKTDCSGVAGLQSGLLTPVDALRSQIDTFNRAGQNLFATVDTEVLRYLVLWGDVVRRQMRYPLDKTSQPAAFQKALIADALVAYVRPTATAQADLGSFASALTTGMAVSGTDETVDVTLPSASGFTAIGRLAAPGKPVTVELLSAGSATVALRLNTQRSGSTRLWDPNRYNRPRFLASPDMALTSGQPVQINSPYGGTLQLVFSAATPAQTVRLRLRGVARHPFLDQSAGAGDQPAFVAALNTAQHEWAEIKLAGIEIHSRADKMRAVINTDFGGDIDRFLSEVKTLFFEDLYQLAGFAVPGKTLTAHVQAMCTQLGWNCTDAAMHRMPGTQHINVDNYAACGSGCSGNPYDQDWGLNPRGWGESHEVGHNLQKGMHKVYDDRSTEVSNNLFPLRKGWRMLRELGDNRSNNRVAYLSAFNMIKAAKAEADPVEGAYQRIWGDAAYAVQNGERMAFYMQWVHYWAQRQADIATGWDIVTLLYLHQRQFDAVAAADWAANRAKLGYSTYATKPSPSGNDNLLITLSWITGRDHRATFDVWGVRYSAAAAAQVAAFGFAAEPALLYANTSTNDHSTVRKVDMSVANPVWPY